jgi:hypothetical protein
VGTMSSYGLHVNIGTMISIVHSGYGAWACREMANTQALATAHSGDMCGYIMKYYGPSFLNGLGRPVSVHNWAGVRLSGFHTAFPAATIIISQPSLLYTPLCTWHFYILYLSCYLLI